MKSHYTYRLIALNPVDERVEYVGVRSCNGLPENDTRYQGSSKHLPRTIQYRKEIIAVWPTREEAVAHEVALHDFHDVARSTRFFNKAKQTAVSFDTAGTKMPSISEKAKIRFADPAIRKQMSIRAKTYNADPSVRANLSAKAKAQWANPEDRAANGKLVAAALAAGGAKKTRAGLIKYFSNPENRKAVSDRTKNAHRRPEVHAKMLVAYNDSERNAKCAAAAQAAWDDDAQRELRIDKIKSACASPEWKGRKFGDANAMASTEVKARHHAAVSSPEARERKKEVFATIRLYRQLSGARGRSITLAQAQSWLAQHKGAA